MPNTNPPPKPYDEVIPTIFVKGFNMKIIRICLPTILALGLLVGCDYDPIAAEPDSIPRDAYPAVTVMGDLENAVVVATPIVQPAQDDEPMVVSVPVRLLSDEPENCQYQFTFLDKNGMPLKPQMEWRYVQMPPRTQIFLEGVSLKKEAVQWRLTIRPDKGPYDRPESRRGS